MTRTQIRILMRSLVCSFLLFGPLPTEAARNLSFAIIGDAGHWNAKSESVQRSILAGNVTNLILPGDNLYDTSKPYSHVWGHWSQRGFRFSVVAIGNHNKTYASEIEFFKMPGEAYTRTDGQVRFIVLNSDNAGTAVQQARYLEQQLLAAREGHVFVVFHHPSYTVGKHTWGEKHEFQVKIRPLLKKYQNKITALIVGHDHIASLVELDQLPMIVSGAVWESNPIKPVNYVEGGTRVSTRWLFRGGYYWARLDISGPTGEVWVNFVSASTGVSCSARIAPRPMVLRPNCTDRRF